jgi:Tol biopolymer transport system component
LEFAPDKAGDRLVYSSLTVQRDLWSIPLLSDQRGGEPERLTDDVAEDFRPSISLDGHHLAYISSRSGNRDVWYRSLQSGKEHAITASPEDENWPVISPDGRQVIYTPYPHGREMLPLGNFPTLMSGVESGGRETICSDCQRPEAWSADGKFLLFLRGQPGKPTWVSLRELATGKKVDLLNHPEHNMSSPRVSPDGRWIAFYEYISPQSRRIWVAPFRGAAPISQAEWTAVTDGTTLDREPRWSTAGDLLYFNSTRDGFICVWAQRLDATTRRPIGPAFPVAHFHRARLSFQNPEHYSASGSRIIITLTETRGNVWLYEQPNIPARPN